jgi:hypothetical protein
MTKHVKQAGVGLLEFQAHRLHSLLESALQSSNNHDIFIDQFKAWLKVFRKLLTIFGPLTVFMGIFGYIFLNEIGGTAWGGAGIFGTIGFLVILFQIYRHYPDSNIRLKTNSAKADRKNKNVDDNHTSYLDTTNPAYSFIREGKYFNIKFEDEKHIVSSLAGLVIIEALLMKPNIEFSPIILVQLYAKKEKDIDDVTHTIVGNDNSEGYESDSVRDQSTIDGIARYKKEIAKLEEKMNAALEKGDDNLAKKHDLKIHAIEKRIHLFRDNRGNDREMKTSIDRAANTVHNNIRTAKSQIKESMPKFHRHLTAQIKRTGNYYKYSGDVESLPAWSFE